MDSWEKCSGIKIKPKNIKNVSEFFFGNIRFSTQVLIKCRNIDSGLKSDGPDGMSIQ